MKLSPAEILDIKTSPDTIASLARKYKVSESAINYHHRSLTITTTPKLPAIPSPKAPPPQEDFPIKTASVKEVTLENGMLVFRVPISELIAKML